MTTWSVKVPAISFRVNKIVDEEKKETVEELLIDIPEGSESVAFLAMTKQLQNAMMKSARSTLPVKTVPAPTVPVGARSIPEPPKQVKMPAVPIMPPRAPTTTVQHQRMPVRPPMSPSAIKPKKMGQSPSFGRLMNEQRMAEERRARAAGQHVPVIPTSSFERLLSETAARNAHKGPPPVLVEENPDSHERVQTEHTQVKQNPVSHEETHHNG
jgi:hypothetical protein